MKIGKKLKTDFTRQKSNRYFFFRFLLHYSLVNFLFSILVWQLHCLIKKLSGETDTECCRGSPSVGQLISFILAIRIEKTESLFDGKACHSLMRVLLLRHWKRFFGNFFISILENNLS